jgi:hypothetical protein
MSAAIKQCLVHVSYTAMHENMCELYSNVLYAQTASTSIGVNLKYNMVAAVALLLVYKLGALSA